MTAEGLPSGKQFVPFLSGRPKEYFAALELEFPDNDLPEMIQRQHKRDKGETSSETLALTLACRPVIDNYAGLLTVQAIGEATP